MTRDSCEVSLVTGLLLISLLPVFSESSQVSQGRLHCESALFQLLFEDILLKAQAGDLYSDELRVSYLETVE